MTRQQAEIDDANADFWDELCGTTTARALGIEDASPESLRRFDRAYLDLYPYLPGYLSEMDTAGERLLEVGLGFGTVSQMLAERGVDYHGLDIAPGPVEMVRSRLRRLGVEGPEERVRRGSILEAPYDEASFDRVVAIGCLHHTGDLRRAVSEVHRLLCRGGTALAMVYNKRSLRRGLMALRDMPAWVRGRGGDAEGMRRAYDSDTQGGAAPATEYVSKREAESLFGAFSVVRVQRENFDMIAPRGIVVSRRLLLGGPAHAAGLDLYITAKK